MNLDLQFMNKVFVFSINFTIRVSANSSGYMVFNLVFNFAIKIICDNTLQLVYYLLFIHIFTYLAKITEQIIFNILFIIFNLKKLLSLISENVYATSRYHYLFIQKGINYLYINSLSILNTLTINAI